MSLRDHHRSFWMLLQPAAAFALFACGVVWGSGSAEAVPSFAVQTGKECASCHVGGFGPQLTPFGREFKLEGYTQRAGSSNPLSVMAIASFLHTSKDQDPAPAAHTATNDNLALDQISGFLAGGLNEHFGGFIQATYDGVHRKAVWDNLDLRAVTHVDVAGGDLLAGASLNNSPGVQDPWNTLAAWGFPYTSSGLAPAPAAAPLLSGGLAQTVLGMTGYLWWNSSIYAEVGAYSSPGRSFLIDVGINPDATSAIKDAAPYARLAYQTALGDRQTLEVGGFLFNAALYPGRDQSSGTSDKHTDLGLDASYQYGAKDGPTISVNGRYTHESLKPSASLFLGGASNPKDDLNDIRMDVSYYTRKRIGGTLILFDTWGKKDINLYPDSRTGSPNSSGLTAQIDFTPWGAGESPLGPRFNARFGVQATHYIRFDGASHNYDGAGANASDNDSVRIFAWLAY